MNAMRNTIILAAVAALFLLASCGRADITSRLSDIESYIDSRPDSALAAIRQIDTTALHGRAVKAKYSLLHAIALDKNYIDTADTRVVQPAVDYYSKHGAAEEVINSYLYLGIEQYNAKLFDQAIISFYKAVSLVHKVQDNKLCGLLYSRIAFTYMATMDYSQALVYFDKALDCFKLCERKDLSDKILAQKATLLVMRRKLDKAEETFNSLLADTTLDESLKRSVQIDYAVFLLSKPTPTDSLSFELMTNSLNNGGSLRLGYQYYAYAYLLYVAGKEEDSASLLNKLESSGYKNDYHYHYWKHAIEKYRGDYKSAYYSLWQAMRDNDSIINAAYDRSAANSQRAFMAQRDIENTLRLQNHRLIEGIILLICVSMALVIISLYLLILKKQKERDNEKERYNLLIDSLNKQIQEKNNCGNKSMAKFALLADIYEEVYRFTKGGSDTNASFYSVLQSKIGDIRSNDDAQSQFEKMLDNETGGIMSRLRKECPFLTESEFRMASYYFAGFDNTTVMLIMDISSLENTRMKKSRLKYKILASTGMDNKMFADLL